jgi:hypothetical protein
MMAPLRCEHVSTGRSQKSSNSIRLRATQSLKQTFVTSIEQGWTAEIESGSPPLGVKRSGK